MKDKETTYAWRARPRTATDTSSDMISVPKASAMLGVTYKQLQTWCKAGKFPCTPKPNGSGGFLVKRSDFEAFMQVKQTNEDYVVKPVKQIEGFEVPQGFDVIKEYKELSEYTLAFAAGEMIFLLLLGSPGSGKSKQMKADVGIRCAWIDNHVTNLGVYCRVYHADGIPVILNNSARFSCTVDS